MNDVSSCSLERHTWSKLPERQSLEQHRMVALFPSVLSDTADVVLSASLFKLLGDWKKLNIKKDIEVMAKSLLL